jgi:hypothetical protein
VSNERPPCSIHEAENVINEDCDKLKTYILIDLKLSQQQDTMKSSRVISHINVELVSDISETVSISIIRCL